MPSFQVGDHHITTKPAPTKREPPSFRRASAHSPKSSLSLNSARRASVATKAVPINPSTSSSAIKSSPAVKSSSPTTLPEWIAPPGRYSPSQIPAPKFVTLGKKRGSPCGNEKGSGSSGVLKPITPVFLQTKEKKDVQRMQKTPWSPLLRHSDKPKSVITGARRESIRHEEASPKGLGLSFEEPPLDARNYDPSISAPTSPMSRTVDVAPPSASPSGNFITTNATTKEVKRLTNSTNDEKDDSLPPNTHPITSTTTSTFLHPSTPKPHSHLSSSFPSPLPSPSLLHPYTSGIHILPSCTSGSLTHRLLCTHLILTATPELCAQNCYVANLTFEIARLEAQGFVANVRVLDEKWQCPICEEGRAGNGEGGKGKRCVGVLGREMLGGDDSEVGGAGDGIARRKRVDEKEVRRKDIAEVELDTKVLVVHQSR